MASVAGNAGNITVVGTATAKFLLQTADASLPSAQDMSALGTGVVKNTTATGVQSLASAGVDFSKGPWKLFSTVRNVAAAQTLSIPVVDGEGNGIVRATGRIISDGTDRTLTIKINGSATNVSMQFLSVQNSTVTGARTAVGSQGVYGCAFELVLFTAKTANALKRSGFIRIIAASATLADSLYTSAFHFKDSATTITTIDLDCGNATGMAANTEALIEEGIVS